ncbi:hypothetical protein [Candidatus Odyssella thessalonicensis]|uniref:hypothetical protein n=1 Tax=Candidatus Odyssella thessalonicensis TaxID=84647 RepID=UPI000225AEC8|nr:hypothetical protein [Candidatus Odyssella thessalonicensis]
MLKLIFPSLSLLVSWTYGNQRDATFMDTFSDKVILIDSTILTPLDIDHRLLEESNRELCYLQNDLKELKEIQQVLQQMVGENALPLAQSEAFVIKSTQQTAAAVENLEAAKQQKTANFLQFLLLQDGIPLGAGALLGTTSFLATKAAFLSVPPLALTGAPIVVPAALAAVTGGAAWFGSKFILHKLNQSL